MFDFILEQSDIFISTDIMYHWYMGTAIFLYFILKYLVENKIYKSSKKKKESVIFNMKIITISVIISSSLEIFGFHNKEVLYLFACVSVVLVAYNIGSWGIFKKMATVLHTKKKVEDEVLIKKLSRHIESSNISVSTEFKFNGKKYICSNSEKKVFREFGILLQTNKTVRLYDMFLALVLFFFTLVFIAYVFGSFISKDSMVYGVLLLFGAAFILPYLQDVKHTIRFANNKYLAFGAFASFYVNGKELFGEIIDMNLYEIILMNHWNKTRIIISHNEIKTFTVYDNGRLFSFLYVVSKDIKYRLYDRLKDWLTEYSDENGEVLNISTFKQFFKTKDDDHGLQFFVFIKQEHLKKYALIVNEIEHHIQLKSDERNWDLCTPKRVDFKIINSNNSEKGDKIVAL